jgi:hypothetical protein
VQGNVDRSVDSYDVGRSVAASDKRVELLVVEVSQLSMQADQALFSGWMFEDTSEQTWVSGEHASNSRGDDWIGNRAAARGCQRGCAE